MKTFLRKAKLSFIAMLCGWIACNIAWWVGAFPSMIEWWDGSILSIPRSHIIARDIMMLGGCTGIVISATWLVVLLPTDLCVANTSRLRQPLTAAVCGFFVTLAIAAAIFSYAAWFEIAHKGFVAGMWRTLDKAALPYALGTCATGTVAAYVRARMDQRKPPASP